MGVRNGLLISLLMVCSVVAILLNVSYLKHLVQISESTRKSDPVHDSPVGFDETTFTTRLQTRNRENHVGLSHENVIKEKQRILHANSTTSTSSHRVAGLNCDKYGGPSQSLAAEMVYWRDIAQDADYKSPYVTTDPIPKYLTFEPDEGGWNNIRMSMETATVLAQAMGRILVLPPQQQMYLLNKDEHKKDNRFTFKDFFHFDSIEEEHPAVQVISMEEFMKREGVVGGLKDKHGRVSFPPGNATTWDGHHRQGQKFWAWMRNVTAVPILNFDDCVAAFPETPGKDAALAFEEYRKEIVKYPRSYLREYNDKPTPVDAPPEARLREILGDRRKICIYGSEWQDSKVMHFMGDNASGARLLIHFYAFLFFENWKQDLWTKRFVRDHLRYVDEIQCAAARVVHAVREKAKGHGDPKGDFDTFHIRRGDFQYKETRIDAAQIYNNVKDVLVANSTVFIATDEKEMSFFEPMCVHFHCYFLKDFMDVIGDINKNYFGMLDQRIASRGRTFVGAYFSTFSGYINRMRGYHAQMDKSPGYELGHVSSYYYVPTKNKEAVRHYVSVKAPFWAREFPVGWRDIDHDLSDDVIQASRWQTVQTA